MREAVDAARRFNARRTYLTGFGHEVSHEDYTSILEFAEGRKTSAVAQRRPNVREGIQLVGKDPVPWSRPAFDGLKVVVRSGDIGDSYS